MNNMKAGYKQTEVGVIPCDWEVKLIKDYSLKITDGEHLTPIRSKIGYYLLSARNILNGKIDVSDVDYVASEEYHRIRQRCNPEYGDVLISCSGSIGRVATVPEDFECVMVRSAALIKPDYSKTTGLYIQYYLQSSVGQNQIFASMNQGAQPNLFLNHIQGLRLAIPSTIEEQTLIATALSDADALISSLEKLIAKKRNIKQGAMQKLLEPKEGWVVNTIIELADKKKELFDDGDWVESEHITNKGIRLIQTGNIGVGIYLEKDNKKYISEESFFELGCKELRVGDLLICRLAEPAGRACIFPSIGEEKVITSVDVSIFSPSFEKVNRQFLNQIFSTNQWFNAISDLCGGTTHKRISRGALGRIEIQLPKIEEQIRIATILSDVDAEIAALETKLEKYKMIKLGMMQNLLTGKIRLV